MSVAHVNPDDLRKLQSAVKTSQTEIDQAIRKLQSAFQKADWKDAARQQFEGKLNEAVSGVRQTKSKLAELEPILAKKSAEVAQYLGR
ncbi:MAG: WXG100 family type VII secretion target [Solirubrobacteraceae bacterium]|nr:hypothetical protein [Patulibacter sp.]